MYGHQGQLIQKQIMKQTDKVSQHLYNIHIEIDAGLQSKRSIQKLLRQLCKILKHNKNSRLVLGQISI